MQVSSDVIRFAFRPGRDADNPPPEERGPVRPEPKVVTVPASSTQHSVVLTGFRAEFSNDRSLPNAGDHHLGQLEVRLNWRPLDAGRVEITARVGLRDWSHEWDDPFEGEIKFAVISE